jgi:hypothetical protein
MLGKLNNKCHIIFFTNTNLLWKLVTLVSRGISWDHVCTFRKLFTPSRVKDA